MGRPQTQTTSPTKNGKMRPDRFWLLKYENVKDVSTLPHVTHDGKSYPVQAIFSKEVDFDLWNLAPRVNRGLESWVRPWEIIVGRRINDEVELFGCEGGKEVPGLRGDLERIGLTVRSYVPEPEADAKKKFKKPTVAAILGAAQVPQDTMASYGLIMQTAIASLEVDEKTGIEYGVIADSGNKSKHLLVCKLRKEDFEDCYVDDDGDGEAQTITTQDVKYRVLGGIDNGQLRFKSGEEVLKPFFKNEGKHVDVHFFNRAKEQDEEDKAALKAQKKLEKKHRRQVTAFTLTSTHSDDSSSTLLAGDDGDEAVKARQREKQKAKKAQQARKKAAKATSETDTVVSMAGNEDEKGEEPKHDWEIEGTSGSYVILRHSLEGTKIEPLTSVVDFLRKAREKRNKERQKAQEAAMEKLSLDGPSSSSSETEVLDLDAEGEEVDVVRVEDMDDISKAVENAKGPVIVVSPVDLGIEEEEERQDGFKYLGRGL